LRRAIRLTLPVLLALAAPAGAAVFTVTKTADTLDGDCGAYDCSLREAVVAANKASGTDVIELPPGTYVLTRTGAGEDKGATGDLDVADPLILVGTDAGSTVLDGNGTDRVLDVRAETEIFGVTVRNGQVSGPGGGAFARAATLSYNFVVRRSVISGNRALGSGGDGGGLMSETSGVLAVLESTLSDNRADAKGGGLAGSRLFWLIGSTVSGNSAGVLGGGLYYPEDWSPVIWGSTLTANQAGQAGGGIYAQQALFPTSFDPAMKGSIVAGNTAPAAPDCFRADSAGYNVIGVEDGCFVTALDRTGTGAAPLDPKLGALGGQGLGGPTPVHLLLSGSPALDLVPAAACTPYDQLGRARSAPCEAGAVDLPLQPVCLPGGSALCLRDGRFKVTALWSGNGTGGEAMAAPLTDDTGNYGFFSPENLELTVKVLDGCAVNDRWWVFSSGLTDRGVDLRVEDLYSGEVWTHRQAPGNTYQPRLDTSALDVCHLPGIPANSGIPGTLAIDPVSSVLVVTKVEDTLDGACDHDCSLREAVAASNVRQGLEVILLGGRVHTLSRAGRGEDENATGDLDVQGALVILGAGAGRTVIDGGAIDRILESNEANSRLEIHGVTLRNGKAEVVSQFRDAGSGGAIAAGYLTLVASHVTGNRAVSGGGVSSYDFVARDTTVSDNEAIDGGGIDTFGFLRLANVTVSGNRAQDIGGGIRIYAFDQELDGVTIVGNSAGLRGGGIHVETETCPSSDPFCRIDFVIRRSIVAGNQAPRFRDCYGFESAQNTHNVFGIEEDFGCNHGPTDVAGTVASPLDPRLTPLGDHGGPTPTHALLADSPAVDLGPAAGCAAADQRGRMRPADGDQDGTASCDAGAVERLPGCQPDETTLCLGEGDRFRVTAIWEARGKTGDARSIPLATAFGDTGSFWFFNPANVELTLKVLDGCAVNDRVWVFASGLTDVGVHILVEDLATGQAWTHHHAPGAPFQPRLDTNALACPEVP
jgi:CSLREA domain-containing protein